MKKLIDRLLKSVLSLAFSTSLLTIPINAKASTLPFKDVPADAWYYQDAKECYDNGIFTGKNEQTFAPSDSLKIAEAAALAARINAKLYNRTILPGGVVWFEPYFDYLYGYNLIDASKKYEWKADAYITRADMIHILYWALKAEDYTPVNSIEDDSIPDVTPGAPMSDEIYDFYRAGIVNGNANTHYFKPGREIQRAEVAAIVNRILNPQRRTKLTLSLQPVPDLTAPATKENVLSLLNSLDPNGYFLCTHSYEEEYPDRLMSWFEIDDYILADLPTAVHEQNHIYTFQGPRNWDPETRTWKIYDRYYLGAEDSILVPRTPVFNSTEAYDSIDPEFRKNFLRLDMYMGPGGQENLASKVDGVYGMLNEWNAYYWGLHNRVRTIHYQKESFYQDHGYSLAYAEFGFMILHYLHYAKENHPDVYEGIMNNTQFKKAFLAIFNNYSTLMADLYERFDIYITSFDELLNILEKLNESPYSEILYELERV